MIEHQKDTEATQAKYASGEFVDSHKRSFVSISGHQYLAGRDVGILRQLVFARERSCALCQKLLGTLQGDLEHIQGGKGPRRCDCYHTRLADGTEHTNVRRTHGMWDSENCHRSKHHRE